MSFFEKVFGAGSDIIALDQQESFAGVLYAIISADGTITEEEDDDFMTMVFRSKLMEDVTKQRWRNIMTKMNKLMSKGGAEALVSLAVQNIPSHLRASVFCYACELVFADGHAHMNEQKILDIIKRELNIEDEFAYKVAEVVMVKSKL